jgi:hypothetical protein
MKNILINLVIVAIYYAINWNKPIDVYSVFLGIGLINLLNSMVKK